MLLVYATTRATNDGWGASSTLALLGAVRALIGAFVVIELRSPSPLLPMRIFRSRTLTAANAAMAIVGAVAFSEFFLLTLYLQDVLHYSAVESGVAFTGFALTVVAISNVAQVVVGRLGVRPTLTAGLVASALSVAWLTRLPSTGSTSGISSPRSSSAARASASRSSRSRSPASPGCSGRTPASRPGLVNTSRQIGGAVGIAAVSAIAATSSSNYADAHALATASSSAALDHGFQTALYVLTGMLVVGASSRSPGQVGAGSRSTGSAGRRRSGPARGGRLSATQ